MSVSANGTPIIHNQWVEQRHSKFPEIVRSQPRDRSSFVRSLDRRRNTEKWTNLLVTVTAGGGNRASPPSPERAVARYPVTFPREFWWTLGRLATLQQQTFTVALRRQILLMWPESTDAQIESMIAEELKW